MYGYSRNPFSRYDGTFTPSESTTFVHDGVTMTEYEKEPFIIGDYNHNQIEFMDLSHAKWFTARPFPFQERFFGYAAVTRPGQIFIIGGCCNWSDQPQSDVSLYKNDQWQRIGVLKQGRMNHIVVLYGWNAIIIGGKSGNTDP